MGMRPVSQSVAFTVRLIIIGQQYDKNRTDLQGKVTCVFVMAEGHLTQSCLHRALLSRIEGGFQSKKTLDCRRQS